MKLRPLEPTHRCSVSMANIARKLGILDIVVQVPRSSDTLIIVADGDPEDHILPILAKVVNGIRIVDVVFPKKYKELSIFNAIGTYIDQGYSRIVVIIDQERYKLEELIKDIKQRISTQISIEEFHVEGRALYIEASRTWREISISIVINGLDDDRFAKHTIEDHLLKAGEILKIIAITNKIDPKEQWWKHLNRDQKMKILEELANSEELVKASFPQHIAVLKKVIE